jgi:hypothetical protein
LVLAVVDTWEDACEDVAAIPFAATLPWVEP